MAEEARASLKLLCATPIERGIIQRRNGGRGSCEFETDFHLDPYRHLYPVGMAEEARASLKHVGHDSGSFLSWSRNGGRGSCEFETPMRSRARATLRGRNGGRGSCEFETSLIYPCAPFLPTESEWRKRLVRV